MSRLFLWLLVVGALCGAGGAAAPAGQPPLGILHEAVVKDQPSAIRRALEAGADIDETGPGGQTPLMFAVLTGKPKAVKALLGKGASTTLGEKDGYTPLHGAGFQGRAEIAQLLIDHGLDISDRHADGHTPVHRACWGQDRRHTETVRVLLEAGVPFAEYSECLRFRKRSKRPNPGTMALREEWVFRHRHEEGQQAAGEQAAGEQAAGEQAAGEL